nr:hypothetical protein [Kibdelosporangium sp. MJ126-NF4]
MLQSGAVRPQKAGSLPIMSRARVGTGSVRTDEPARCWQHDQVPEAPMVNSPTPD